MPHEGAVLQVDALGAVICNDGEILLHAAGVELLVEQSRQLVIEALQRQNRLRACLATRHKAGAVDAEKRRARHDAALLVPTNGEMRYRWRCDGERPGNREVRQLQLGQAPREIEERFDFIDGTLHGISGGIDRRFDGGLDTVPNAGRRALHSIEGRAYGTLDSLHHRGNRGFYPVPDTADGGFDAIQHRCHGALDGVPYGSDRSLDAVQNGGDGSLYGIPDRRNDRLDGVLSSSMRSSGSA